MVVKYYGCFNLPPKDMSHLFASWNIESAFSPALFMALPFSFFPPLTSRSNFFDSHSKHKIQYISAYTVFRVPVYGTVLVANVIVF